MNASVLKLPTKRGRPSTQKAAEIDRAILSLARSIFLEEGYDALAMDGIAATLGVSKGTIYSRHRSKEALLYAVIREGIEEWSNANAETDRTLPAELGDRLRYRMRVVAGSLVQPENLAFNRLLYSVRDRFPEISRLLHEKGYLRGVEVIVDDLRAAAERDGIPARDPDRAAQLLLSTITGWHIHESGVRSPSVAEMEEMADRAVEMFLLARPAW